MKSIIFCSLFCLFYNNLSGQSVTSLYNQIDELFEEHIAEGNINYITIEEDPLFDQVYNFIATTDLNSIKEDERKAFAINAYNIAVIQGVLDVYPTTSVQKSFGFFDQIKRKIAGMDITLNDFEKKYLLETYQDPRLHFVLVCGAVSCPPIIPGAYRPEILETQLDKQTSSALNDPEFIKTSSESVAISQIFKWYSNDFGGSKSAILGFINSYREEQISENIPIEYYGYNWQLNDQSGSLATNAARYVVSAAIPESTFELKIFNNLYSEQTGTNGELVDRSTFFTTAISAIYGVTNRFNAGLEIRYRRVLNNSLPSSPFDVFQAGFSSNVFRQGVTAIGPRIRFAPVPKWQNFSIQSTFYFPIGSELSGSQEKPYIDWSGFSFWTQFFNDFTLGNHFSLFTEIDLFIEDIGPTADNHANRFSTPATIIISYFPNPKTTVYVLSGFSPFWQSPFDYFVQGGVGAKYQFTPNFELELLYTKFSNKFLLETEGKAATYNFGIRSNF